MSNICSQAKRRVDETSRSRASSVSGYSLPGRMSQPNHQTGNDSSETDAYSPNAQPGHMELKLNASLSLAKRDSIRRFSTSNTQGN